MNKKAISYAEFLSYLDEERLVLTSRIKDNWDAQRYVDYINELYNNGNADNLQFLLSFIGKLEESIEVIISMEKTVIIKFYIKSLEEKEREYLSVNWQKVLSEVHSMIEKNNSIEDSYIESMLVKLKLFDHEAVEILMTLHEKYKANR